MIQANELRIGNWIRIRESDTKVQVEAYMLAISELSNCQPIPLTPEILEKCGFEKQESADQYGWYLGAGRRCLCWCYSDIVSLEFKKCQSDYSDTLFDFSCKYLHQLQNLYFALTSEELTFKP
jgi:hypothetical protein